MKERTTTDQVVAQLRAILKFIEERENRVDQTFEEMIASNKNFEEGKLASAKTGNPNKEAYSMAFGTLSAKKSFQDTLDTLSFKTAIDLAIRTNDPTNTSLDNRQIPKSDVKDSAVH